MTSVVLLRHDKAGDALKTLPALRVLRASRPEWAIWVVASASNASLFESEPGIHTLTLPPGWKKLTGPELNTVLRSSGLPDTVDFCVSLLCDPFPETAQLFATISAKNYASVPLERSPSVSYQALDLPGESPAGRDERANIAHLITAALGVRTQENWSEARRAPVILDADRDEAFEKMGPKPLSAHWLGVCPFAGLQGRTHPLRRWEKFIARLSKTAPKPEAHLFLFGLPENFSDLEKLRRAANPQTRVDLCFPSSFRALGGYLERLDGVIAVDSGPLHLAHALGVRALGVLSGGDVARWFPEIGRKDYLLPRGRFGRYPGVGEMTRAYQRWEAAWREAPC